jgi:hypothetical protein
MLTPGWDATQVVTQDSFATVVQHTSPKLENLIIKFKPRAEGPWIGHRIMAGIIELPKLNTLS